MPLCKCEDCFELGTCEHALDCQECCNSNCVNFEGDAGLKECANCGESFQTGEGFPNEKRECCCSEECWLEFIG